MDAGRKLLLIKFRLVPPRTLHKKCFSFRTKAARKFLNSRFSGEALRGSFFALVIFSSATLAPEKTSPRLSLFLTVFHRRHPEKEKMPTERGTRQQIADIHFNPLIHHRNSSARFVCLWHALSLRLGIQSQRFILSQGYSSTQTFDAAFSFYLFRENQITV